MAERQRVARRVRTDDLFPPLESWWPLGMSLDEWQQSRRAGVPVQVYFTPEREAEIDAWWQAAQERNRERMKDGG